MLSNLAKDTQPEAGGQDWIPGVALELRLLGAWLCWLCSLMSIQTCSIPTTWVKRRTSSHFTGEENETWRGDITCLKFLSQDVADLRLEPRPPSSPSLYTPRVEPQRCILWEKGKGLLGGGTVSRSEVFRAPSLCPWIFLPGH